MTTEATVEGELVDALSPAQAIALRELLVGKSITSAAETAGVTRWTVSNWANHDGPFQRALRELKREPLAEAAERLKHLAVAAVEALGAILTNKDAQPGDQIRAAGQILRACGFTTDVGVCVGVDVAVATGSRELPAELTMTELRALARAGRESDDVAPCEEFDVLADTGAASEPAAAPEPESTTPQAQPAPDCRTRTITRKPEALPAPDLCPNEHPLIRQALLEEERAKNPRQMIL